MQRIKHTVCQTQNFGFANPELEQDIRWTQNFRVYQNQNFWIHTEKSERNKSSANKWTQVQTPVLESTQWSSLSKFTQIMHTQNNNLSKTQVSNGELLKFTKQM